jgi:parvulin-like peptidyl-prolyl isomerase
MLRLLTLRSATLAALSLCLILSPAARLLAADDTDSDVIARIGDSEVTAGELRAAIENLDPTTQAAAARDPATLSKLVRLILAQRLVLKEALDKKWDQNPAVTAALVQVRDNAIAQSYLQAVSKPPESYPSDSEIQTAYTTNKSQLLVPRQYEVAQIFIKDIKGSDDATDAKAKVKLESVRKALAKPDADFAAVARAESDEPTSAAKGGNIGWLLESRIQPEIRSQLGDLSKGSITQPVKLEDGWHVLKVLDVKEPYTPTLEEIRPQLAQKMRAERTQQNSQQYLSKLLTDNPVQINELALSKVLKQP